MELDPFGDIIICRILGGMLFRKVLKHKSEHLIYLGDNPDFCTLTLPTGLDNLLGLVIFWHVTESVTYESHTKKSKSVFEIRNVNPLLWNEYHYIKW